MEWYDLSLEAGRNAKGKMKLKYVAEKYKVILKTTPIFQEQLKEFYAGEMQTIQCYRGDRKTSMLFDIDHIGRLYDEVDQSLIEL